MKRPLIIIATLAFAGCTAHYSEPTLSSDHPANPAAAESPPPVRSQTLELAAADPVAPAQAAPAMANMDHGAGGAQMPSSSPGMNDGMQKHDAATPANGEASVLYACPMHPEVTSDRPDQRCPKCGMKLQKLKGAQQP